MLKVPFYNQNKDYTCGPAVLRMIFEFYGIKKSEEEIEKILNFELENGTRIGEMKKYAEELGFSVFHNDGADICDLEDFIKDGKPVIVNFKEPSNNEGHYAVVVGVDENNVYLNDPWNGEAFQISRKEFIVRWHNEEVTRARTVIVISK